MKQINVNAYQNMQEMRQLVNYFSRSDINAFYSEDYSGIIISFAKEISQSNYLSNCNGLFQLPLSLMNNNPECV